MISKPKWKCELLLDHMVLNVSAASNNPPGSALVTAENLTKFYTPADIAQQYELPSVAPVVFRITRIRAKPVKRGGGSAVLEVALKYLDTHGYWAVLEPHPYPGHSKQKLIAFFEGFRFNLTPAGSMYRSPLLPSSNNG